MQQQSIHQNVLSRAYKHISFAYHLHKLYYVVGEPAGTDPTRDKCRYYGKMWHWARDFRKKKREEAHLV